MGVQGRWQAAGWCASCGHAGVWPYMTEHQPCPVCGEDTVRRRVGYFEFEGYETPRFAGWKDIDPPAPPRTHTRSESIELSLESPLLIVCILAAVGVGSIVYAMAAAVQGLLAVGGL